MLTEEETMWIELGLMVENEINEGIVNAFKTLLSNLGDWLPPLSGL